LRGPALEVAGGNGAGLSRTPPETPPCPYPLPQGSGTVRVPYIGEGEMAWQCRQPGAFPDSRVLGARSLARLPDGDLPGRHEAAAARRGRQGPALPARGGRVVRGQPVQASRKTPA
jgi:hypothetical protein